MKLKGLISKYGSSMIAFVLTLVATQMASRGCYYIAYQPKAPEGLKKFAKK